MANELIKRNASTRRNSAAVSTLAMGALTVSHGAQAALIVQDVGQTVVAGETVAVDLFDAAGVPGQDGLDDFEFSVTATSASIDSLQGFSKYRFFVDNGGNGSNAKQFANTESIGLATLDKALYFGNFYTGAPTGGPSEQGYWNFGDTGFLGIQFDLSGAIHYGWLEITVGSLEIGRFGFETEAGVAAVAGAAPTGVPEPSGLALLATGAAGLLAFRRRKREA